MTVALLPKEGTLTVGQTYLVRTVKLRPRQPYGLQDPVPVIGPVHEDGEHLEFPVTHVHIDYRFVDDEQIETMMKRLAASPFSSWPTTPKQVVIVAEYAFLDDISETPTVCVRTDVPWRRDIGARPVFRALEEAYKDVRIKPDCRTCPHRGVPLPNEEGGAVVCPGHGLKWSTRTGRLLKHWR